MGFFGLLQMSPNHLKVEDREGSEIAADFKG
jgi:hypothetical protein